MTRDVALQLYSVRNAMSEDIDRTLERVAEIGFRFVELYNFAAWHAPLREGLAAHGLAAPTAHARLVEGDNAEELIDLAAELGVQTLIDPMVPAERWANPSDIARTADRLAELSDIARERGMRIGYHNHWWETESRVDGATALEALAERLPEEVLLEIDVYWAIVGGETDAAGLLRRLGDRVRFLHVKDAPEQDGSLSTDREDQLPVGEGSIEWGGVIEAAPAADLLVVEFDEFRGDIFDGIARGLAGARPLAG
ncbi:sugar phosphate isomerase/epimerase [Microbacterium sp. ZXX196]|uniref:sugar phosphate isomerase/epimerase family protein n=1 Tax=Microbacterium sp. ZXX196 TaxID=2609291 RepID=UPI0012B8E79B|nr:sugar phosphate isomerase/epimerase [Microbacterium sp. ZXX196]MTE23008.1 TIM barrel protein [Microbacterium sp. ZXX196]